MKRPILTFTVLGLGVTLAAALDARLDPEPPMSIPLAASETIQAQPIH